MPKRQYFYVQEGTPVERVLRWIKGQPYLTMQHEIEDCLSIFHYPHSLQAAGVEGEELSRAIAVSIHRLQQQLSALELMDASTSGVECNDPELPMADVSSNGSRSVHDIFED